MLDMGVNKMTDNVFSDLGFDPAEAHNLKLRSQLMLAIKQYVKVNKLTQAQAAEIMGVDQPRINKVLSGHIELFTIDKLVTMLERAKILVK